MDETPQQIFERCVRSGQMAVFEGRPSLRAEQLRAEAGRVPPPPAGVRVRGARIEGDLDLSDLSLRALVLEACDIDGLVDLTGAHLGRVSLRGSRFCGLVLHGGKIDGMVDVSFASPLEGPARIDARNVRISGGLVGESLRLKSPPPRPAEEVLAWAHNWALDLTEARIDCGCMLYGETVIDGGISLDSCHVVGGLSLRGAHVIAGEGDGFHPGDAIRGPNVHVDGDFHLNFGFRAQGRLFLLGARITNRLSISGKLSGTTSGYDWAGRPAAYTSAALQADYMHTGASLLVYDSEVEGQVGFNNAVIGKNVSFAGTRFLRSGSGATSAIAAQETTVGGGFAFGDGRRQTATVEGKVVLRRSTIDGELNLVGLGAAATDLDLDITDLTSAGVVMPQALG